MKVQKGWGTGFWHGFDGSSAKKRPHKMPCIAFSAGWTIDVSCGETGRRIRRIYACPSVLPFGRRYARPGAMLSDGTGNVMG